MLTDLVNLGKRLMGLESSPRVEGSLVTLLSIILTLSLELEQRGPLATSSFPVGKIVFHINRSGLGHDRELHAQSFLVSGKILQEVLLETIGASGTNRQLLALADVLAVLGLVADGLTTEAESNLRVVDRLERMRVSTSNVSGINILLDINNRTENLEASRLDSGTDEGTERGKLGLGTLRDSSGNTSSGTFKVGEDEVDSSSEEEILVVALVVTVVTLSLHARGVDLESESTNLLSIDAPIVGSETERETDGGGEALARLGSGMLEDTMVELGVDLIINGDGSSDTSMV